MLELIYIYRFYFRQVLMIWEGYEFIKNMLRSTQWSEQKTLIEFTHFFKVMQSMCFSITTFKQRN